MGTNYYWLIDLQTGRLLKDPKKNMSRPYRHIGKRSCLSKDRLKFTLTREVHKHTLQALLQSQEQVAINEYGDRFTAREMLDIIGDCVVQCQVDYEFS